MKRNKSKIQIADKNIEQVELITASEIIPEPIDWLWLNWIAKGKLQLLAGMAATGKTTLGLNFAATVSSGGKWPDDLCAIQGKILIWSGEDDIKDTLIPRLVLQGANTENIYFISTIAEENGVKRSFNPANDISKLENNIEKLSDVALIIIDPIVSMINRDSNSNGDVRKGLQPLIDLASKYNIAILGITHFSKGTADRVPLERVTGSLAFGAVARIVLVTIKDLNSDGRYILAKAKANICTEHDGFYYSIEIGALDKYSEIITSKINWGQAIYGSTTNLLSQTPDKIEKISRLEEAKDFLLEFLSTGPQLSTDVATAAEADFISKATLRRAKENLGIESIPAGVNENGKRQWAWQLPIEVLKSIDAQAEELSIYENEHLGIPESK